MLSVCATTVSSLTAGRKPNALPKAEYLGQRIPCLVAAIKVTKALVIKVDRALRDRTGIKEKRDKVIRAARLAGIYRAMKTLRKL